MPAAVHLESITHRVDYCDPILLYHHLMGDRAGGLLLESAEIDSKRHLNSYLLVQAALEVRCDGNRVALTALTDNGLRLLQGLAGSTSLTWDGPMVSAEGVAGRLTASFATADPNLDEDQRLRAPSVMTPLRMIGDHVRINSSVPEALFLGGLFGYDLVECFESLPDPVPGGQGQCPNYLFYVAEQLIHLDHRNASGQLIGSWFYQQADSVQREAMEAAVAETARRCQNLNILDLPPAEPGPADHAVDKNDEEFNQIVTRLKERILEGEVFQIVPSRSFSLPCRFPLRAYRRLRKLNPSPYMFYMSASDFVLFGASPEMAVRYSAPQRLVEVCPIAGTRHRGKHPDGTINHDLDGRIELELRTDTKEMAEHLMLVDLARNDLARICEPGSRHVAQLLKVDRYSHVMHLVSRVAGHLRSDLDALHAWQACMNMGTLTGAPKVRAMQLIRQTENSRRDHYGGGIGYLLGGGDMETCIVIRAALVVDGMARVQAGAGIVHDSVPQSESDETRTKAAAVLTALQTVHE